MIYDLYKVKIHLNCGYVTQDCQAYLGKKSGY